MRSKIERGKSTGKAVSVILVDCMQILCSICYLFPPRKLVISRGETPQLITSNNTIKTMKSKLGYFIFLQQALWRWLEEWRKMTGLLDKPFHNSSCAFTLLVACTKFCKSQLLYLLPCTIPKYHI